MPTRTFLAIDLDDAILDRLEAAQKSLDDGQSKINWVARPNVHLTLNFLGDVPDEILSDVCAIAAGVDRGVIEKGAAMLGVELTDLITNVIMGMREKAADLGLAGGT